MGIKQEYINSLPDSVDVLAAELATYILPDKASRDKLIAILEQMDKDGSDQYDKVRTSLTVILPYLNLL